MTTAFTGRSMRATDIGAVLQVQAQTYPAHFLESEATIRARLHACPDTAWVLEDRHGVCAYLVAYPSHAGMVTPFDAAFSPTADADCIYLHDLAVAPRASGCKAGIALVDLAWRHAVRCGLACSALVSVQDSRAYWQRLGYREHDELDMSQRANLQSYAGEAFYMLMPAFATPGK